MARSPRYLTALAAARELGVTTATLYSYVSRGLVRSEAAPGDSRARRYHAADVRRLKERKAQRRDPARAAQGALYLGDPVLESAITLIEGGRFYYRGQDALELAAGHTLEQVAALVWSGTLPGADALGADVAVHAHDAFDPVHPIESFQRALTGASIADPSAYDLRPPAVARTGGRIVRLLTSTVTGGPVAGEGAAGALQRAWCPDDPDTRGAIDAALVLCVDHELNASAFTARCAASARATPYGAVIAGFAALGGTRQSGGEVERVEGLFDEIEDAGRARRMVERRLRRGEGVPGFGHPLYPEGDPRGVALLDTVRRLRPASPAVALADELAAAAKELIGEGPVVDLGLVALARALGLPPRGALTLFAIGRSVGLVAHALEQYAIDRVIRPRARYVGPQPAPGSPVQQGSSPTAGRGRSRRL